MQMTYHFVNFLVGETQPDVNLTVLPSLRVQALSSISIVCDADVPRFQSVSSTCTPLPPVRLDIRIGEYRVKSCRAAPVNNCTYTLPSFFPILPRKISCTAFNIDGGCRFKTANVIFLSQG